MELTLNLTSKINDDGSFCLVGNRMTAALIVVSARDNIVLTALSASSDYVGAMQLDSHRTAVSQIGLALIPLATSNDFNSQIINATETSPEAQAYIQAAVLKMNSDWSDLSKVLDDSKLSSLLQKAVDALQSKLELFPKAVPPTPSPSASKQRDTQRLSDIQKLSSALELFFNDNGGYPAPTAAGSSVCGGGGTCPGAAIPSYIYAMPVAPTPADGGCTNVQNTYTYTAGGTSYPGTQGVSVYPTYTITFCLGDPICCRCTYLIASRYSIKAG